MFVLFCIFLILIIYGIGFSSFRDDYMSREQTNAIKGIFAAIVLLHHMREYLLLENTFDLLFSQIDGLIGQSMVTVFFFYSGYGVMEAWRKKPGYVKHFFRDRFLRVLVHFDCALILYMLLNLALGIQYEPDRIIWSWTGWTNIGNSNWFVFDMLVMYLVSWVFMTFCAGCQKREWMTCLLVTVTCFLLRKIYMKLGLYSFWWDTLFCYPVGLFFSMCRKRIDWFAAKPYVWWPVMAVFLLIFAKMKLKGTAMDDVFCGVVCCILVVGTTMKVKFGNAVLKWLGDHAFSIYILQRLPMILCKHLGWNDNHILFICATVSGVLLLAFLFERVLKKLDSILFSHK